MLARATLTLLALVPLAAAETVTVPGDFETIQAAVDGAADGDTIVVKKGTYAEAVTVANRHDLTLVGKGKPVVDATGHFSGFIINDSTGIELRGFTVRSHSEAGIHVRGSTDVLVSKCLVTGGETGIHVDDGTNVRVEKNRIETVTLHGILLFATGGGGGDDCHVLKNRIVGSAERGISVRGEDNLLERNVIEDADVVGVEVSDDASLTTLLRNRIQDGAGGGIFVNAALGTQIERNTIRDLGGTGLVAGFNAQGLNTVKNKVTQLGGSGFSVDMTGINCDGDRLSKLGVDGMDIDGPDGTYLNVKVISAIDEGWDIDQGSASFTGCSALKSGSSGFLVDCPDNEFTKCKASGSGDFDLFNVGGEASNTFTDCKFKTTGT
jgi:hypothetical protein